LVIYNIVESIKKGCIMEEINIDLLVVNEILKNIDIKLEIVENLLKEGKVWYAINKIMGLRQKIQFLLVELNTKNIIDIKSDNENNTNETVQ